MGVASSNHRTDPVPAPLGSTELDAVVVGSGPNGLAAAIALANEGLRVHVIEGHDEIGGGMRTAELTLPGFQHDVCSTAHPMGILSPFLASLPLERYGLEWAQPEVPVAHALEGGRAALLHRDVRETAAGLGRDEKNYRRYFEPIVKVLPELCTDILRPIGLPRHPISFARFGMRAMLPAAPAARVLFRETEARALFAGNAAHSILPLNQMFTSGVATVLMAAGHAVGWPFARGGSQSVAKAMAALFEELGGSIETGRWIRAMSDLPTAKAYLFDLNPAQLVKIAGEELPESFGNRLDRFRHGAGVYKLDMALSGPISWSNPELQRAGTVHLGGPIAEIEKSERACWEGRHVDQPFTLLTQPSLVDPTRAPAGKAVAWAYCHVPSGSTVDHREAVLGQIERFAPGFRKTVLALHEMKCADFERYNPNYVGGDIIGGAQDWRQLFTRPVVQRDPYATPDPRLFLCSASTPPGGGVHGMCGHGAARSVLHKVFPSR